VSQHRRTLLLRESPIPNPREAIARGTAYLETRNDVRAATDVNMMMVSSLLLWFDVFYVLGFWFATKRVRMQHEENGTMTVVMEEEKRRRWRCQPTISGRFKLLVSELDEYRTV